MEKESKNLMNDGVKKQIVQDVQKKSETNDPSANMSGVKRSIRDIPIPQNGAAIKTPEKETPFESEDVTENHSEILYEEATPTKHRDTSKYVLWGIVVVSVIALVFAVSSLFTGATVTITPKTQQVALNETLSAATGSASADVPYQVVQISDTISRLVDSDTEEFVESKASGQIVIYNNHSSATQELIKQTRFQSSDGKIYRIQEAVTVPGQKVVDGEKAPGQLEVTVYADEEGSGYNIGLTEFTIPGFQGDPRFDSFSARSKTPMTGGFAGTQPVVDEATKARTEAELQELLKERLSAELSNRVSTTLIIPENGSFFTFESLPATQNEDGGVELVHKGTVKAVALPTADFAKAILRKAGGNANSPIKIQDLSTVNTTLLAVEEFNIGSSSELNVSLTGNALLVWSFEEEVVREQLAGKQKKELSSILSPYESIEKARAVIRPFWKRSFPADLEKITIKTELE